MNVALLTSRQIANIRGYLETGGMITKLPPPEQFALKVKF